MSKSRRLLVGILSFLPLTLFIVYLSVFLSIFFTVFHHRYNEENVQTLMLGNIATILSVALLLGLSTLGALIYFIIHVVNNRAIESTERIIWILLFIFAGMLAYPVYWYMRIWKLIPAVDRVP